MSSDEVLKKIYYDTANPASYGGVSALVQASGLKRAIVEAWLRKQATYTLHKPARIRYSSRKYRVSGLDQQFQSDLVDMQAHAKENDGFKYILTVIDMFSRYAWALPLKTKSPKDVKPAFEELFAQGRKPLKIQTDQGTEFESTTMREFFKSHGVEQFSVKSQFKAAMVERFNRTLKTKMWRYFTHNNTHRWVNVLQNLLSAYNKSKHRSINMAPAQVNKDNEMELWMRDQLPVVKAKHKLKIGDHVRISKVKGAFKKGYLPNWTEEVFTISRLLNTKPPQVKVQDYNGEEVEGSFYYPEIQQVHKPDVYRIEQVLKERTVKGKKEYLVKWKGYPAHFNQWISKEQVENV